MNKNVIQFIVDENGTFVDPIPVGRVKATSNLTTRIQLVTPITASVAVNYVIYDSKNIQKKQYLIPSGDLGSAVVDPNSPNYQLVAGWNVYEADIYAPILSVISKYRTGKVGMSFEFVQQVPNALCTNFIGYFGFTEDTEALPVRVNDLPETANNGDYYICEDYNFWIGENLYNKGDILVYYNQEWHNGGILPKGLTETVDISVDPAISYSTEEEEEVYKTAFGNAIGEIAEDVAELDTRLDGVENNLNAKQDKVDALIETTDKTVVGAINELNSEVNILDSQVTDLAETKQNKTDNDLDTASKTVVGAINEVYDGIEVLEDKVELVIPKANGAVRFDITQTLSDTEKSRARINIGVYGDGRIDMIIVSELPEVGELGTIYLLPNENPESSNLYTEWIYINDEWELWGVSSIDLSDYISYTQDDANVGKTFVVGADGRVELVDFPTISVNGIDYLKDPDKTYLVIKTPADNDTFTLLTGTIGSPNYTIEWGDGTSENITSTANPSHEYATAGMYLITISDDFTNGIVVGLLSNLNKDKIIEVYGGNNYPLTIGQNAFNRCTYLTTANFPNVTDIENNAFYDCTSLTTVNCPNVMSIANYAFQNCSSLTTVNIPNVTSIVSNAFEDCTSLTIANFPNATSIGQQAFIFCTSLTIANFPNATSIADGAFHGCTSLATANFPNATSIENNAFYNCISLKELTIGNVETGSGSGRFQNVKLVNLTIAQDVDATDIDRIKQLYADNGGTFIGNETKHGLQVEKTPTADNDVVRKVDIDNLIGDIDLILDNINGEVI